MGAFSGERGFQHCVGEIYVQNSQVVPSTNTPNLSSFGMGGNRNGGQME